MSDLVASLDADWEKLVAERVQACRCRVCGLDPELLAWIDGKIAYIVAYTVKNGRRSLGYPTLYNVLKQKGVVEGTINRLKAHTYRCLGEKKCEVYRHAGDG